MKIVICYDGSADAQAAIYVAGELYRAADAVVLTVWDGLAEVLVRAGNGLAAASLNFDQIDRECERVARECSQEGAALAREAGLDAEPRAVERSGSIWETILDVANQAGVEAIVLGSRGLTGLKSLLLGSVSHAVLQHADRPVIVVPSLQVAERRSRRRSHQPAV